MTWSKADKDSCFHIFIVATGNAHELCAGVNKSDECIEVNLSTIFQSIHGTKQYWFHRSSELKCMLREWGSNSLHYFRLCCAEYYSEHIARYLREVNPPNVPVSKCCTEDPILVSWKFSLPIQHCSLKWVSTRGYWALLLEERISVMRGTTLPYTCSVMGAWTTRDWKEWSLEVLAWIQERITCKMPDAALNPELHAMVTKYQMRIA